MEYKDSIQYLIELVNRPAFCAINGIVHCVNNAASQEGITIGTSVSSFLCQNAAAYNEFTSGNLYCIINLCNRTAGVTVTRLDGIDYFLLDEEKDPVLKGLSLAAQQLRKPLSSLVALMDSNCMHQKANTKDSANTIDQINKGLLQINRQLCNMSDAALYSENHFSYSTVGLRGLFAQLIEKAAANLENAGIKLAYEEPDTEIYTQANATLLERAGYNLISNAVKFSSPGSTVFASLKAAGNRLIFTVQSRTANAKPPVFDMFRREPGLEDSRYGIGLGMVIVRAAALAHGGTVLVDYPDEGSTRISISLEIREDGKPVLRNNTSQISDYSGGFDHALLELSDVLPSECYRK